MLRIRLRLRRWLPLGLCAVVLSGCQSWGGPRAAGPDAVRAAPPDAQPSSKPADVFDDEGGLLNQLHWPHFTDPFAPPTPAPPADSFTLRPEGIVQDRIPKEGTAEADLLGARELFRRGDYSHAESLFARIADNTHNTVAVAEEARYYEAECLRLQGRYPRAADVYSDLLNKFPQTAYREQAVQRLFDIANYWLDDTRQEMVEWRDYQDGKRWTWWPHFINFGTSKPLLDREGRAINKLEQVRMYDMNGPYADKALFLCGSVAFYNENYKEADEYFAELVEKFGNTSPLAPQAVELGIIAKHLSTGGSDYDARKVAEARKMVQTAFENYPDLAGKKKKFLTDQLIGITMQQAEKDFKQAEFYRKTDHPGPAYFYHLLVIRTYPGTPYAAESAKIVQELEAQHAKEHGGQPISYPQQPGTPGQATPYAPTGPTGAETAPMPRALTPVPGTR
jgi:TolA-binding protein